MRVFTRISGCDHWLVTSKKPSRACAECVSVKIEQQIELPDAYIYIALAYFLQPHPSLHASLLVYFAINVGLKCGVSKSSGKPKLPHHSVLLSEQVVCV